METFDLADLYIGQKNVYRIPVVDAATRLPQALTGLAMTWTLRSTPTGAALLTKTIGAGLVLVNYDGVDDAVELTVARADTYTVGTDTILIPAGTYYWGLSESTNWIPLCGGSVKAVLHAAR